MTSDTHSADTSTSADTAAITSVDTTVQTITDTAADTVEWLFADDALRKLDGDWTWLYYSSRGWESGGVNWQGVGWQRRRWCTNDVELQLQLNPHNNDSNRESSDKCHCKNCSCTSVFHLYYITQQETVLIIFNSYTVTEAVLML